MNTMNEFETMWDNCTSCGKAVALSYIHLPSGTCNACRPRKKHNFELDDVMKKLKQEHPELFKRKNKWK